MKPPIIVDEHGDVSIYRSVDQAERALEAIDVKNNEYIAYDAEGRRLYLSVVSEEMHSFFGFFSRYVERVKLKGSEHVNGSELRELLIQFLTDVGIPRDSLALEDLKGIVQKAVDRLGYTR